MMGGAILGKTFDLSQLALIGLMAFANLIGTITFSNIVPFFPEEAEQKGMSTWQVGLVIGVFQLTTFFVSPILGKYMVVLRANRTFTLGLIVTSLCTIAFGFSRFLHYGPFFYYGTFLIRIGQSIGYSAFITSSLAILGQMFPDRIAMITGLMEVPYGLGCTIGPIIGGALYELGGFQVPLFAIGASYAPVILASMMLYKNSFFGDGLADPSESAEGVPSVLSLLSIPDLSLALCACFLSSVVWSFYEPSLANYMETFDGWSPSMLTGLMMALVSAAYLVTVPIWGHLLDRHFADQTASIMMLGSLGLVVTTLLMGPSPLFGLPKNLIIIGVGFTLLGFMTGIIYVPIFKWLIDAAKNNGYCATSTAVCGCLSGLMQSSVAIGVFLGNAIGGLSAQHFGFPWTATLMAAVHGIFIIVQIFYRFGMFFASKRRSSAGSINSSV